MHVIASQKFHTPRQEPDGKAGQYQRQNTSRDELVIGRFAPAPVSNEDDGYYWTDEGYEHLRDGKSGTEYFIPRIVLTNDLRSSDGFLEAISERSLLVGACICCIVLGVIVMAGAVGLERVERSSIVDARV
jgi:hypothetical protein